MMRALIALCLFAALSPAARAQESLEMSTYAEVAAETRVATVPGPLASQERRVYAWRPPNAPTGVLPVIYMADGDTGLYTVAAYLRPAIRSGRLAPIIIIGIESHPSRRFEEYVPRSRSRQTFNAHQRWFLDTVMPWAETVAGAASAPRGRAIGGYSNGADFALATVARNPGMFVGVLAHSPVQTVSYDSPPAAQNIRWGLTAGRQEEGGRIVRVVDNVAREVTRRPNAIRRCVGPWDHRLRPWLALSPGAIAWIFQLDGDIETDLERAHCGAFTQ